MDVALKGCFADPLLEVMNFLNEVMLRYPGVISFAPGRPAEQHFDVERSLGKIALYVEHRARAARASRFSVYTDLGQYSRTNGIIHDLIARQLEIDEAIRTPPESIVVTSGCQEGMTILLAALFDPEADALLVSDPTYIGITGIARILGVPVVPIPAGPQGLDAAAVAAAIDETRRRGLRPRALYEVPDFSNPLGTRTPLAARQALLALARERELLIFEDNPYGMFEYDGAPLPTLKSLDEPGGQVIYMGSFSKTLFPGLRLGYLVADQAAVLSDGRRGLLAGELSKIKSLTTINTPPIIQAIVGGILLENGGSLAPLVAGKVPAYRLNRDRMLACLEEEFGAGLPGGGQVLWNRPSGGFFLTLDLPFEFDQESLETCARDYGVVVCPMTFFALSSGRERQVRLAFSYVTPAQIEEGVRRFARFVRDRAGEVAARPGRLSAVAGSRGGAGG
ncbi:MAG: PLP-dependent aminotransferase family protein [Acidobacteriota bacterium]|nr:PLP-dependent aminotransferase family protein [Acidobacteriota bacterium]